MSINWSIIATVIKKAYDFIQLFKSLNTVTFVHFSEISPGVFPLIFPIFNIHISYLNAREGSYCSGEDGGVMSSLCGGGGAVCEVLKSRFTTPASCFWRFAFGAKKDKIRC